MSVCQLVLTVLLVSFYLDLAFGRINVDPDRRWWEDAVIYEIYPQSFYDSDGDGYGDLRGITEKLDYLEELRIDAVWLNPFNASPMKDNGYDISDFRAIHPRYGTMSDFKSLVSKLKRRGINFIMDFVPNHTSDQHEWFKKSVKRIPPYTDYYVWVDAKGYNADGSPQPPNNWEAMFGKGKPGSAWTWNERRKQFYLHQFMVEQPDLNLRNGRVVEELKNVMKFWINRGVMGFRLDAVPHLFEDEQLRDEPSDNTMHTTNQPETYELVKDFRRFLDQYGKERRKMIFLTTEGYSSHESTMLYYGDAQKPGAHFPFNFLLLTNLDEDTKAQSLNKTISNYLKSLDKTMMPNWVSGNHDWPRIPSRMGARSAVDMLNALSLLLPGTSTVFMGDEIGMDSFWDLDKQQCPPGVRDDFRTPGRTPFQWTNKKNAGFTNPRSKPWIPINPEYYHVNVASEIKMGEREVPNHLSNFKNLISLKKFLPTYESSTTETYVISKHVLAIKRQGLDEPLFYVILVNLGDSRSGKLDLKNAIPQLATSSLQSVPMTGINTHIENCNDQDATSCDMDNIELGPKSVAVLRFKEHRHEDGEYTHDDTENDEEEEDFDDDAPLLRSSRRPSRSRDSLPLHDDREPSPRPSPRPWKRDPLVLHDDREP